MCCMIYHCFLIKLSDIHEIKKYPSCPTLIRPRMQLAVLASLILQMYILFTPYFFYPVVLEAVYILISLIFKNFCINNNECIVLDHLEQFTASS
jgi:hypothetical protein